MSQEQKEVTEDRSESGGPCVPCTVTSLFKQGKNGVKAVPVSPGVSLTSSQNAEELLYPQLWFVTPKMQMKICKEGRFVWGGLQGDQAGFHLSLPGWLHTQCLPPPVTTCDSTHQAFAPARLTRACVQRFCGGLGMKTYLTAHREAPPRVKLLLQGPKASR